MHRVVNCQLHVAKATSIYFFHRIQVAGIWQTRTWSSIFQTVSFANIRPTPTLNGKAKKKKKAICPESVECFYPHMCFLTCLVPLESQVSNWSFPLIWQGHYELCDCHPVLAVQLSLVTDYLATQVLCGKDTGPLHSIHKQVKMK